MALTFDDFPDHADIKNYRVLLKLYYLANGQGTKGSEAKNAEKLFRAKVKAIQAYGKSENAISKDHFLNAEKARRLIESTKTEVSDEDAIMGFWKNGWDLPTNGMWVTLDRSGKEYISFRDSWWRLDKFKKRYALQLSKIHL